MGAMLLEGKPVARDILAHARDEIAELITRHGRSPELAVVRCGDAPDALAYLKAIRRSCRSVELPLREVELSTTTSPVEFRGAIAQLNHDPAVAGILVLQPLPPQLSPALPAETVAPLKDVDGITIVNAGRLFAGLETLLPSTPAGGLAILRHYDIPLAGQRAVVLGRSLVVGRPMALLLLGADATVTIAHSRSRDLTALTCGADILLAAVGRPGTIRPEMVKPGATVIDFGVSLRDGTIVGDVDPAVAEVAGALTPVPGGTGVVTNAILINNLLKAARWQQERTAAGGARTTVGEE
ncbi:MAG TPA: bifunctional 5,10-methylenetetrahydrofolate dehydrogenase/5,10-methenyltetrahydrofolate cyclohydrolase [Thermomicrobiaceae bacterium]|nr:bifunctional 5,10-methylenetetrahydrofolate dehydrogenase/5,10-methenyltetrahydrofolate cyclohydrolase [Thermomicrobiaceae bacterium]